MECRLLCGSGMYDESRRWVGYGSAVGIFRVWEGWCLGLVSTEVQYAKLTRNGFENVGGNLSPCRGYMKHEVGSAGEEEDADRVVKWDGGGGGGSGGGSGDESRRGTISRVKERWLLMNVELEEEH
ncbi:uncharacterized protein UTRI_05622 [Ustilago trichophora]|uniref:Uncharacterized protein n=1 Tax=Ustilago trichophora TaxID=86804 RepID=A0A5C3EEY8_9BASI|nr:uncharacterized protein UTRI_05622 [Ustilago trichophora]